MTYGQSPIEQAKCIGKHPYSSRLDAKKVVARMKQRGLRGPGRMEVYRCSFCDAFHIGNERFAK